MRIIFMNYEKYSAESFLLYYNLSDNMKKVFLIELIILHLFQIIFPTQSHVHVSFYISSPGQVREFQMSWIHSIHFEPGHG